MATWRALLRKAMDRAGDHGPVVHVAPSEATLDVQFDAGYGAAEVQPVLVWTEERVYFPVVYDGSEWLGSAPRNPQADGQWHEGRQ